MKANLPPSEIQLDPSRPFFATEAAEYFRERSLHLLGFCFDGTTSFRPGSRFGADAIRECSFGLETYSPYLDLDTEDYDILDLGNMPFYPSRQDKLHQAFEHLTERLNLAQQQISLLCLGGEHSISYSPLKLYLKQFSDLFVLHLDAHTDLREEFGDDPFSHASVIYRAHQLMGPAQQLCQYGIRSGTRAEFQWMKQQGTLMESLESLCRTLEQIGPDRPIYLTLDLDFFEPGLLPGTGTPEAGGENFHSFMKILKILKQKNLVGADVVELAPHLDPSGQSSCFASKLVREVLLCLAKPAHLKNK